jgi:hypothetical protein
MTMTGEIQARLVCFMKRTLACIPQLSQRFVGICHAECPKWPHLGIEWVRKTFRSRNFAAQQKFADTEKPDE